MSPQWHGEWTCQSISQWISNTFETRLFCFGLSLLSREGSVGRCGVWLPHPVTVFSQISWDTERALCSLFCGLHSYTTDPTKGVKSSVQLWEATHVWCECEHHILLHSIYTRFLWQL